MVVKGLKLIKSECKQTQSRNSKQSVACKYQETKMQSCLMPKE